MDFPRVPFMSFEGASPHPMQRTHVHTQFYRDKNFLTQFCINTREKLDREDQRSTRPAIFALELISHRKRKKKRPALNYFEFEGKSYTVYVYVSLFPMPVAGCISI